jgi:hypothetical protein
MDLNITKRHVTGLPIFKEFARFDYEVWCHLLSVCLRALLVI